MEGDPEIESPSINFEHDPADSEVKALGAPLLAGFARSGDFDFDRTIRIDEWGFHLRSCHSDPSEAQGRNLLSAGSRQNANGAVEEQPVSAASRHSEESALVKYRAQPRSGERMQPTARAVGNHQKQNQPPQGRKKLLPNVSLVILNSILL
jgi:hypothetical protein